MPIWRFARFETISWDGVPRIKNKGKQFTGSGHYSWYKGNYISKRLHGVFRYEVQIVSVSGGNADCFFGFGRHGIDEIGNTADVDDIFYYNSYRNPLQLYPSKAEPRFAPNQGRSGSNSSRNGGLNNKRAAAALTHCKVGEKIRFVYDKGLGKITFYLNHLRVGSEQIPVEKKEFCFAPYVAVRGKSTKFRLLASSFTPSPDASINHTSQLPGFNIKALYNVKQRYNVLHAARGAHGDVCGLVDMLCSSHDTTVCTPGTSVEDFKQRSPSAKGRMERSMV